MEGKNHPADGVLPSCHPGVIERWELLQAQDLSKELRSKQSQQQWQQLNSDLNNVWSWLGETGEELEQQRRLDLSTDIQTIEQRIKKLKVRLLQDGTFSVWSFMFNGEFEGSSALNVER